MKYTYNELFGDTIEGEGPLAGVPTVYVRFSNCNFSCRGFNNPNDVDPYSEETLGYDPKRIPTVQDIPEPISIGCDTLYSHDKRFKHMWKTVDEVELANSLTELLPARQKGDWSKTMLSITGGEPTLHQKQIPTLLKQREFDTLRRIIIETNCAVPLKQSFIDELNEWVDAVPGRMVIWSNSPKLSASGEPYEKAIKPEIAMMQRKTSNYIQYFKFVCDDKEEHFEEVQKAMNDYYAAGIPEEDSDQIYIMPMSCTEEQQAEIMVGIAEKCIDRGWVFCLRVHNVLYANAIGK